MRTIKFRGKDEHGCWHIGWLAETNDGTIYIIENDESWTDDGFHNDDFSGRYKVLEKTVGQFTGLLDKNGKEIYEGDICHLGDPRITYVVLWVDCGLKIKQIGSYGSFCGVDYWADSLTIVGDIHDNPELLKNKIKK